MAPAGRMIDPVPFGSAAAVHGAHAHRCPGGRRLARALADGGEAGRQLHLGPPGLPALPAAARQIGRGGCQRVGRVVRPDVAAPVAGEIDGVFQERRGHELRVPHRARPGPQHVRRVGVAGLDDLQGRDQLLLKHLAAAAVIGQRRQRRDDLHLAAVRAEVRFHAPDRQHDLARHAVARLDRRQGAGVAGGHLAAGGDAHVRHRAVQIQPDRACENSDCLRSSRITSGL